MPLTSVLRRWRPENQEFRASLGCLEPSRTGLVGLSKHPFTGVAYQIFTLLLITAANYSHEVAAKLIPWSGSPQHEEL